ncbi:sugar kinase [Arenicella sp. 4NH20-0111]|uniref:sugar kinase n=1 Tax=Arenicella sp. 4NH20-0111 TaxID=3127648 RepID=UPI003341A59C
MLGECMLELSASSEQSRGSNIPCQLSFGGDSLNTSVYLARLRAQVSYFSALGDDSLSRWMVQQWADEGVNCENVVFQKESVPGMYLIELDSSGERSFKYWRKNSPASQWLNDAPVRQRVFKRMHEYGYIYLSGISLAILPHATQAHVIDFLKQYRESGGQVVFDGNYRANLWPNRQSAVAAFDLAYGNCDIALSTLDDEMAVYEDKSANDVLTRLKSSGVSIAVVKMGENGCHYSSDGRIEEVPAQKVGVVDTTSAGDSFNAGFLASYVEGAKLQACCEEGHRLAAKVIQHKGAIIPLESMR